MLLNLGASYGQVRAPRPNAAFGHLANLPFGVNKAFEDLCLLKLVLEHTLLGFITVSVGLRYLAFFYFGQFGSEGIPWG